MPQPVAIDADLPQPVAFQLRAPVAEHDSLGIERQVVPVENAAVQLRHDFAHLAAGQGQDAQIASPAADVLEIVVVVLAVVRVAFDEQDLGVPQQRVQIDQHAAPHRRHFGHQAARRLVGRIDPPGGQGRQFALVFVQPAEQFGGRILRGRSPSQFGHRGAQPRQIAAQRGQHRRLDAQIEPARIVPIGLGLLHSISFRAERIAAAAAIGDQLLDQLFLPLAARG